MAQYFKPVPKLAYLTHGVVYLKGVTCSRRGSYGELVVVPTLISGPTHGFQEEVLEESSPKEAEML